MTIFTGLLAVLVIGINLFFISVYVRSLPDHWALYLLVSVLVLAYILIVLYLVSIHCYVLCRTGIFWGWKFSQYYPCLAANYIPCFQCLHLHYTYIYICIHFFSFNNCNFHWCKKINDCRKSLYMVYTVMKHMFKLQSFKCGVRFINFSI